MGGMGGFEEEEERAAGNVQGEEQMPSRSWHHPLPSAIAVGTMETDGRGIMASQLALQLPKPMAEILHLTGAQSTTHAH